MLTPTIVALSLFLDWKAVTVNVAGNTADVATTLRFLHTGQCVETNRALGPQPSTGQVITAKAVQVGATIAVSAVLNVFAVHLPEKPRAQQALRLFGTSVQYANGGLGAWWAVQNVRHCGY